DVSRKLVQIFFATSQLKKDFGVPNPPPPAEVRRLGVVGSGFMGSGIAGTAVVQAGVDVRMKDADLPRVAKGLAAAREILDDRLKRRRITPYEHARLIALLSGSDHYTAFGRAEPVIEAAFEDLQVKQQVLHEVESVTEAGHVLVEGVAIEEIDRLMVEFGFPVGPITLMDEVGMDVGEKVVGVMHEAFGERFAPVPAFAGMVKSGRLGRKVGKGFYQYA